MISFDSSRSPSIDCGRTNAARESSPSEALSPLNDRDGIAAPEEEDLELREAMNDRLLDIIAADEFPLPRIIEIEGTPHQRLRALERAVAHVT